MWLIKDLEMGRFTWARGVSSEVHRRGEGRCPQRWRPALEAELRTVMLWPWRWRRALDQNAGRAAPELEKAGRGAGASAVLREAGSGFVTPRTAEEWPAGVSCCSRPEGLSHRGIHRPPFCGKSIRLCKCAPLSPHSSVRVTVLTTVVFSPLPI